MTGFEAYQGYFDHIKTLGNVHQVMLKSTEGQRDQGHLLVQAAHSLAPLLPIHQFSMCHSPLRSANKWGLHCWD